MIFHLKVLKTQVFPTPGTKDGENYFLTSQVFLVREKHTCFTDGKTGAFSKARCALKVGKNNWLCSNDAYALYNNGVNITGTTLMGF